MSAASGGDPLLGVERQRLTPELPGYRVPSNHRSDPPWQTSLPAQGYL